MSFRAALASSFRDALTFWLPVSCAGCGIVDADLCSTCRDALTARPIHRLIGPGMAVTSALVFEGVAARVIRALKEEGRTSLGHALAPAFDEVLRLAVPDGALVTTVPGTRAAFRRRGFRPLDVLLRRAGWRHRRLLRVARATDDQRGLGRRARRENVGGAFVSRPVPGGVVVVVDDVVTTGATLVEAARALRAAGADEVVAVALAHTPRRSILKGESRVIET
jgi:predicted amidophosphoribosyltransferase